MTSVLQNTVGLQLLLLILMRDHIPDLIPGKNEYLYRSDNSLFPKKRVKQEILYVGLRNITMKIKLN